MVGSACRASLLKNGLRIPCCVNAKDFLLSQPRGAYTSCRTVGMRSVFGFEEHVRRLARSVTLMMNPTHNDNQIPDAPTQISNERQWSSRHLSQITDPQLIRPLLVTHLNLAVRDFIKQHPNAFESSSMNASRPDLKKDAPPDSSSVSRNDDLSMLAAAGGEFRFTILLTWTARPSSSRDSLGRVRENASADGNSGSGDDEKPFDILIHTTTLSPPPPRPVKVYVRQAEREYALAKDSQWVSDRAALEKDKPDDVNEILLEDPSGRVLEGMTSNFFAYQDGSVYTASTDDGILGGTVRSLILDVCKQLNIPVKLEPPQTENIDRWTSAFISSTSRLLLPIDELTVVKRGTDSNQGLSSKVYSFSDDDVISKLRDAVREQIDEGSSEVIELASES